MNYRHDFIPGSDSEFNTWQGNFILLVEPDVETWSIDTSDFISLKTRQSDWVIAFAKASNRQNRSAADVRAKDDARKLYEKDLRKFVAQWLAHNSKVTDTDRERLGIRVKLETHTPVTVPVSSPVGQIDFSTRQQHIIHFTDSATNGKAKPTGVHGCEIWVKIGGEPPKSESEYTYQGLDTKSPYTIDFPVADIGKTVYYRFRWVNKRGQPGPWSSTVSAVVGG